MGETWMLFAFLSSVIFASPISAIPKLPALREPATVADYPERCQSSKVRVKFVARGEEWGDVWIDGKPVLQVRYFNGRQTVTLPPGGYRVVITGITSFNVWASDYLDVGQTNVVRVAFSKKGGVQVSPNPNVWLPDEPNDPDVWRR
ncbi:hypothetical protein [Kamptonema formosum]|uniref:hypothetical protein n=1 Tax=Kamptonema formosum TaxID=331992 RepID=UPI0012DCF6BE|nr:hypothetical protein [Oscillatoria sp. PCC 10802]